MDTIGRKEIGRYILLHQLERWLDWSGKFPLVWHSRLYAFFNGIQSTRAFFLLTFLLWLQVQKKVKPLKFSNPHIWRAFWVPLLAFLSQLLSTLIFSALCDKRVFHTIFFYKSLSLSPQKMGTTSRTQRFIQWHKQTWKEI